MPAKVNLLTEALALAPGRSSEFAPKLARQSIMVHFRTASALSFQLQEHNDIVSQKEFTCIISHYFSGLHSVEQPPFKNRVRCGVIWCEFCLLKFLPSNGDPYSLARVL
jgi:hypothetical protein